MGYFDNEHFLNEEITAGPSVGMWDSFTQAINQQFRVDSQQALQEEIQNRWLENLDTYRRKTGQVLDVPDYEMGLNSYTRYLDQQEGKQAGFFDDISAIAGAKRIERADMTIRQLEDPELKSYQDIVREVYAMQQKVEQTSADMAERSGTSGTVAAFAGAAVGSFSFRDPINVISLPVGGGGRTVAMRIASEMAVGGAAVAASDVGYVLPNRARAGLPERSLLYDVLAGAVGAGVIRGGFEGISAAARKLGGQPINLDFQDYQLRQMFESNTESPRARAGIATLDDIQFIEHNNPYGLGDAANTRFLAELQDVQRVLGGAPDTAIARVLPEMPFEYIKTAADFEIVREQAPIVYAKLKEAQTRVADIDAAMADISTRIDAAAEDVKAVPMEVLQQRNPDAARVIDPNRPGDNVIYRRELEEADKVRQAETTPHKTEIQALRKERKAANVVYRKAYTAVEAEAQRLNRAQAIVRGEQQADALDLLGNAMGGRTFIGSALTHSAVERSMMRMEELAETQGDRATALFQEREDFGATAEGETKPLAYETADGRIDIGLEEPVDPDFKVLTEDGDLFVREIMNDLKEDERLDEAMRTCLI